MVTVGLTGTGPAASAVRSGLSDSDAEVVDTDVDTLNGVDLGVVIGEADGGVFDRYNRAAVRRSTPWISIEIGGIGGVPIDGLDASIAGFGPDCGCYACLAARVTANDPPREESPSADRSSIRLAGAIAGHELTRIVADEPSPLIGGVIEVPYVERTVLPIPGCSVCGVDGDRTRFGSVTHLDRSLESAIERAERSIDPRVGVISSVGEAESYPAPYYLARTADTGGFSDATAASEAAGVDEDWDRAFMKALGEGLERYAAGVYRSKEFDYAPAPAVEGSLDPGSFVRHETPDADAAIPWMRGISLATVDRVSIPAELVVFPPPERRFGPSITTGLGLGNSIVQALISGLTEVIERDATMLAWYSTFEPLRLEIDDDGYDTLRRRARAEGLTVTPLLVTQDIDIPVIAVAVHREGKWPRFAIGSDAGLSATASARSALAEALQNWMELRGLGRDGAADAGGWIGRYAEFPPPVRGLVSTETRVPVENLEPGGDSTGMKSLDELVDRTRAAGLEPYAVRLTTRDLRVLGFEAVRVVIPSAQPIFMSEPIFGRRAREVPPSLGFEPLLDREPHPYP